MQKNNKLIDVSLSQGNEDVKYQSRTSELDNEYLEAVKNNDLETAQKLVEEAAKKAGYNSPVLYHGTKSFGFTEFDLDKMDDGRSIFLTDSKEIASTYSGVDNLRKKSERMNVDVDKLTSPKTVELLNKHGMLNTFSHELTHIAELSGFYDELHEAIVSALEKRGTDFNELVEKKNEQLRSDPNTKPMSDEKLTYLADVEVIADTCETMLKNSKIFENIVIARLYTNKIINSAEYSEQTSEFSNKIKDLRTERRKNLAEDENEEILEDIKLYKKRTGQIFKQIRIDGASRLW